MKKSFSLFSLCLMVLSSCASNDKAEQADASITDAQITESQPVMKFDVKQLEWTR